MKLEQVSKPIYLLDKITVHKPENLKYVEKLIQLNCKAYHRKALEEVLEEYTESLMNYYHESGSIFDDEREAKEYVEVFLQSKLKDDE